MYTHSIEVHIETQTKYLSSATPNVLSNEPLRQPAEHVHVATNIDQLQSRISTAGS